MAGVHRNTDSRACGASTNVTGQNTVYVNNKLVVIVGNSAKRDSKCPIPGGNHCNPKATSGSGNTAIGGE